MNGNVELKSANASRATAYIGRVGALAVALGIGVAVTTFPGLATAETPSTNQDSGPDSSAGGDTGSAARDDAENEPRDRDEPAPGAAPSDGTESADEDEGLEPADEPDESEDEDEIIPDPGPDPVDEYVDEYVDAPDQEPADEPGPADEPNRSAVPKDQPAAVTSGYSRSPADPDVPRPRPARSAEPQILVDTDPPVQPSVAPPATEVLAPLAGALAPAAVTTAPTGPLGFISSVVRAVLSPFSAASSPLAPAAAPTLWGLLAWVRRQVAHTFFNHTPTLVDNQDLEQIDPDTVTGSVTGTDAEGEALKYKATGGKSGASIVVNQDGTWSYTAPTSWTGAASWTDEFTISVNDAGRGVHLHGLFGLFKPNAGHTDKVTIRVTLPAANANAAPVIDDIYAFNPPDETTGAQIYRVVVRDADGDTLTVTSTTVRGTVSAATYLGTNTGGDDVFELTFTPTAQQRIAAQLTPGLTQTVTVTVSDGTLTDVQDLAAEIAPTDKAVVVTLPSDTNVQGGGIKFGADGTGYLTTYNYLTDKTTVIVIEAAGTHSVEVDGNASGGVVFGPDGTVYQTTSNFSGPLTTTVHALAGPKAGVSTLMFGTANYPAVIGSDGTIYQTTVSSSGSGPSQTITTTVNVIVDGVGTGHTVTGEAEGPVVIGPDGTVYQTAYRQQYMSVNITTYVLIIGGTHAGTHQFSGQQLGSVQIGADGIARQTTFNYGTGSTPGKTRVWALSGPNAVTSTDIIDTDYRSSKVVVGPDGTAYISTTSGDNSTTRVTAFGGPDAGYVEVAGKHSGSVVIAADGTIYQAVETGDWASGFVTVLYSISGNTATEVGRAPGILDGGLVIDADGSVRLVTFGFDNVGQTYVTDLDAPAGTEPVVVGGLIAGAPTVGEDGTLYFASYPFGPGPGRVHAVSAAGQATTIEIGGNVVDGIAVTPDGSVYQVVTAPDGSTSVWQVALPVASTVV